MRKLIWMFLVVVGLAVALPASALAAANDIPGTPISVGQTAIGTVDQTTKPDDVYAVQLTRGQQVQIVATMTPSPNYSGESYVNLYSPSSKSLASGTVVAQDDEQSSAVRTVTYTAAVDGTYFIDVTAHDMNGLSYALTVSGSAETPLYPTSAFLHGPSTKVRRGTRVHLNGILVNQYLQPLDGKSLTLLYSFNGHSWKRAGRLSSKGDTFPFRFKVTRLTYFRVAFGGAGTCAGCTSAKVRVRVR